MPVYLLNTEMTNQLIMKLETAGIRLATVLASQYVVPLQHNAAFWALKVKSIGETLEQWLSVQERWTCLAEIFEEPNVYQVNITRVNTGES